MFEPIYRRSDNSYVITFNNNPFHLVKDDADVNYPGLWDKVMYYITENPDVVQDEPLPPEPEPVEPMFDVMFYCLGLINIS